MDLEQALNDEIQKDIEDYIADHFAFSKASDDAIYNAAMKDVCEDWSDKLQDISPALADWIEWNYLRWWYPTKNNMFNPKFGTESPINKVKEE